MGCCFSRDEKESTAEELDAREVTHRGNSTSRAPVLDQTSSLQQGLLARERKDYGATEKTVSHPQTDSSMPSEHEKKKEVILSQNRKGLLDGKRSDHGVTEETGYHPQTDSWMPSEREEKKRVIPSQDWKDLVTNKAEWTKRENILIMGEKGNGKSTLIDSMINFKMKVRREDKFRYCGRERDDSALISVYQFDPKPKFSKEAGSGFNVVEVKGFTTGEDVDIANELDQFLREVPSLDLVCVVLQAAQVRIVAHFQHFLGNLFQHFGKDIEKHLVFLYTFSDSTEPLAKMALEEIGYGGYHGFPFNASALWSDLNSEDGDPQSLSGSDDDTDFDSSKLTTLTWNALQKSLGKFFKHLESSSKAPCQLEDTRVFLEKRKTFLSEKKKLRDRFAQELYSEEGDFDPSWGVNKLQGLEDYMIEMNSYAFRQFRETPSNILEEFNLEEHFSKSEKWVNSIYPQLKRGLRDSIGDESSEI